MKISTKIFYENILLGIGLIILGIVVSIRVDVWFIKFLGVAGIIFGINLIIDGFKYSQNEKNFEIKNKKIVFNYKEFPLDMLNLKILPYKNYKKVSLFYDKNFKAIFEDLLFREDEFKDFLKIIKPYLKKETKEKVIEIFDDGFSIYGSFFKFDEIKDIKLNYKRKRTGDFIEITLFLKDKNLNFLIDKTDEYEKVMLLKLKVNKNCDYKDYSFVYLFLILGFVLAISGDIYLIFFGFLILIISAIVELNFNQSYLKKLCNDTKNKILQI